MKPDKVVVGEAMISFGGGFVRALGAALLRADGNNTARIKKAFPDYWKKYTKIAIQVRLR